MNLFESLAAVVLITVVIAGYGRKLVTHPNIKVLLGILYLACFLHAVVYSVSKIYQLRLSFFAIDPCHMFLPRWFYILTHTLIVFANCCMQNVQIVLIVERCVATVSVDTYETHSRALGAALATTLLVGTCAEVAAGYQTIVSKMLTTNSMLATNTMTNTLTVTFIVIFVLCCLSLLLIVSLYCFNSRRKKRKTLTSRYQTSENVSTSALLFVISTIELVTFATYASLMTYIRLTANDDPLLDAYKEAAYMVPLCTFLIPLGTIIYIELSKRKRRNDINFMLMMKSQGHEGWQNYASLLMHQWKLSK